MSSRDSETAPAKINLALHVRARERDGYHRIETLFLFARDGDMLSARPADALQLDVEGPFASALADDENLVLRAARALQSTFGISTGAAIKLDKRLPVASGIGGGSADAAAAIRLLCRLWRIDPGSPELSKIARSLGADVPACLISRPVRGEGRGYALVPFDPGALAGMPLVLVNPGVAVSTARIFGNWDGIDRGPLGDGDPLAVARAGRNDLEAPARAIVPEIGVVLAMLAQQPGASFVRMSGSGATCFALFDSASVCDAAAETIRRTQPGWWCLSTTVG